MEPRTITNTINEIFSIDPYGSTITSKDKADAFCNYNLYIKDNHSISDYHRKPLKIPGAFFFVDEHNILKTIYIKKVIYNRPATIVFWSDGTKTVSKCVAPDTYNKETGLVICILKKLSNKSLKNLFESWLPKGDKDFTTVTIKDAKKNSK